MRQIFLFIAILLATAANAQRHTPVEIKQLAYRKLPTGQKPLGLDLDKYITSYLSVNGGGGGGGSVPDTVLSQAIYEEITHTALAAKIADSTLTVGKRYLISDFKTVFNLNISGTPYTDASVESIIVTALTDASLEPIAYSISHPKDILYYDIDGSTYMPGSTKGCIYRRIDTEKNISVPFDFREFKVEYKKPSIAITEWDNSTNYARGIISRVESDLYISKTAVNMGNDPAITSNWLVFPHDIAMIADEFIFINGGEVSMGATQSPVSPFNIGQSYDFVIKGQPTTVSGCLFYTVGYIQNSYFEALDKCSFFTEDALVNNNCGYLKHLYVNGGFSGNRITSCDKFISNSAILNNTISSGFNNNYIYSLQNNTIESDATGNIIGENFRDNTIGLRFQNNTIGTNFGGQADNYGNQIGNDFHDNVIGNYFSGNVIGNWFYMNTVGNDCQENNLPYKFYSNTTGDSFQNWNGQHYLNGVDFTLLTLPVSGATKYIFYDPTDFNSWGYYDNGVFTITAF